MTNHALARNVANKKLAGVAAGLADYFGIDVTLIRIVFVLAAVFGSGIPIFLYVLLWVTMPGNLTRTTTPPRHSKPATIIFLVLVALVVVVGAIGNGHYSWIPGFLFVGLVVFLWWKFRSGKSIRQLGSRASNTRFQEPSATEAPPVYFGGDPTFHIDSFYPPKPPTDFDNPSGFQRP